MPPRSLRVEVVRHGPEVGGLHRAGVLIATLLRACGYDVHESVIPERGHAPEPVQRPDLRVACVNADQFHRVPDVPGVPLVGWWSWEVNRFRRSFGRAAVGTTAVWALSSHAAQAFRRTVPVPVRVLPLPMTPAKRCLIPDPERFQVLTVSDYRSGSARKNAAGAVLAYCRAFEPGSGTRLVVKTSGRRWRPGAARRLAALAGRRPDITLLDDHLSRAGLDELYASSDVLLSLHRAEGFGLPLAEAMSFGAVVVATAHGGPLDFLTTENSVLVPYRLTLVGPGHWPYPVRARWARPDERAAAAVLQRLRADVALRQDLGRRAVGDAAALHSIEALVPIATSLVEEAVLLGAGDGRSVMDPRKPASRWLAGALHHLDLRTRGYWVIPRMALDRLHLSRLTR